MSFDVLNHGLARKHRIAAESAASTATAQAVLAQGYAAQLAAGLLRPKGTYANLTALNAGTPTVADPDEIYITLDDGNWCYHNGTAWVAGGQFQAAEMPLDTTLSVSGMAADAKVTGDKVGELKSAFNKLDDYVGGKVQDTLVFTKSYGKRYDTSGEYITDMYAMATNKVAIPSGAVSVDIYSLTTNGDKSYCTFFDAGDNVVQVNVNSSFETITVSVPVPAGASQVAFSGTGASNDNFSAKITKYNPFNLDDLLDDLEEMLNVPLPVESSYTTFDVNNTSTFNELGTGYYKINYNTPSGGTDIPGIRCSPDSGLLDQNSGKTLLVNIETNSTKQLSIYVYGVNGYAYALKIQGSGTVGIDLANLIMYYSKLDYIVVGVANPDENAEWTEKITFEFNDYKVNPFYSDSIAGIMNNMGNELAALKSEFENDYTTLIMSPNKTVYRLRVDNSGNLSATSLMKEIDSAVFFGNSLLVSNGGSGMCASSPEYDYFSRVCAFLHSRNSGLIYHVWTDEIDGTETAVKANNFAGVFENLTTVAQVEAFLPTLDVYLDEHPDYISIQLGDNANQDVEFFTGTSLAMLLEYCHTKCPNALIVVMGAWYVSNAMIAGMAATTSAYGDIFVNFQGVRTAETQSAVGAIVTYPDRTTHEVTNAGVASHPNDAGFEGIANLVIAAISPVVVTVD